MAAMTGCSTNRNENGPWRRSSKSEVNSGILGMFIANPDGSRYPCGPVSIRNSGGSLRPFVSWSDSDTRRRRASGRWFTSPSTTRGSWFASGRTERSRRTRTRGLRAAVLRRPVSPELVFAPASRAEHDAQHEPSGRTDPAIDQLPANQAADRKVDHLRNLHDRLNLRAAWYPARRRVRGERRRHDDGRDCRAEDRAHEHENDRGLHGYGWGMAASTTCWRLKPAGACRIGNSLKVSSHLAAMACMGTTANMRSAAHFW